MCACFSLVNAKFKPLMSKLQNGSAVSDPACGVTARGEGLALSSNSIFGG